MINSILIQQMTSEDLMNHIRTIVREELQSNQQQKTEETKYLSRKETAMLLKISLPTLNEYTRSGKLKACQIGRRVLYRLEDIESMIQVKKLSRYAKGYQNTNS